MKSDNPERVAGSAMEAALIAWGRKRFGDVRVIRELQLGRRRIDLAFVLPADIVGIEIKGPRDTVTASSRLAEQMEVFDFYLPEVYLAVHSKWRDHAAVIHYPNLLVVDPDGEVIERVGREPHRDEMCCSRLIERLWASEARALAAHHGLVQEQMLAKMQTSKVRKILARLLTGQEIMAGVCTQLRSRPLVGAGSDAASHRPDAAGKSRLSDLLTPLSQGKV